MYDELYDDGMIISSVTDDERTWAKLAHLSAIIAMLISANSLSFLGPLLIWGLQKDKSSFVRHAAADSFNFNIGMWILWFAGIAVCFTIILIPLGIAMILASVILTLWHHLKAFSAVNQGRLHYYPFQLKILS
ncbi:DUF4870 domain-containing protein [Arcanobacterium buesumense]|uniref:DUF4870 domain-containing protein n=2 Tax=Arcanobacterium buesumense TaxID=2722751 RepID=A0A6H2ENS1_9ACTO|nr:DUF4870 domain-containing protein [Arcanobacterium buesumense]